MKEITLPLYADLVTRKLIGRQGGAPELPEKLVAGDQVTFQLRLYERTSGELRERVPVVKSLRATLGKTMEPPTAGTFQLRGLDPVAAVFGSVFLNLTDVESFDMVRILDEDGVTVLNETLCGDTSSDSAGVAWFLANLETFEDWFTFETVGEGGVRFTCTSEGQHIIEVQYTNAAFSLTQEQDQGTAATTEPADTADIAFNASAAAFTTAVSTVTLSPITEASSPASSCWLFRLEDGSEATLSAVQGNELAPASFVRVRKHQRGDVWWHEVRLIQTPLAATNAHERVLPDAPSIRQIQGGGSSSSSDDIEVNEIQALTLPDDFRGTYVLGFDVRQTDLLGIDDGPEQIAAALNAMWSDGKTRFEVTNPESGQAYIEFVGELADTGFDLITATVKTFEPGVLTFTLDLKKEELAAALRAVAEVTVNFEVELAVLPDGEDPETSEVTPKVITAFQQSIKVTREQGFPESDVVPAIDWLHSPAKDYVPFSPTQVITGQQHYTATFGNGAARTFSFTHGLDTEAISSVTVRENTAGGALKVLGTDYALTIESADEVVVAIKDGKPTPAAASLAIVITSAGPASVFQAHTHPIGQITGLEEALAELGDRLAAIEDLLPTVSPTTPASSSGTVQDMPIPEKAELFPGRFGPDFNPETAVKNANVLPRPPGLLPALHVGSSTAFEDLPLPTPTEALGTLYLNETGDELLIPGGLGRRSSKVPNEGFFTSDGRVLYRLSQRDPAKNSYFPTDFERELFTLHINDKMLRAGTSFQMTFDLEAALVRATTKAQVLLVIEVGTAPSETSPGPYADNLAGIDWEPTPLLEQRIILTEVPVKHSFGAQVNRSALGVLSASRLRYGQWEGSAQAPAAASFVIRGRLVDFDTENAAVNERGYVFYAFKNPSAAIQ